MSNTDKKNSRPKAIAHEFVVHKVDDEVLLYNLETNDAACLQVKAHTVWQLCDGTNSIAQIIEHYRSVDPQCTRTNTAEFVVFKILDELKSINLIESESLPSQIAPFPNDRRQFLQGAAVTGIPLVVGLPIPAAAQNASCLANTQLCDSNSECCSGCCHPGPAGRGRCRPRRFCQ